MKERLLGDEEVHGDRGQPLGKPGKVSLAEALEGNRGGPQREFRVAGFCDDPEPGSELLAEERKVLRSSSWR